MPIADLVMFIIGYMYRIRHPGRHGRPGVPGMHHGLPLARRRRPPAPVNDDRPRIVVGNPADIADPADRILAEMHVRRRRSRAIR